MGIRIRRCQSTSRTNCRASTRRPASTCPSTSYTALPMAATSSSLRSAWLAPSRSCAARSERSQRSRHMNRREFVRLTGSGVAAGALAEQVGGAQMAAQPNTKSAGKPGVARVARMKAGTQHGDSDAILRVLAGFGVNHICSRLPAPKLDASWSVESLTRLRERVESFGLTLDMVPLPLSSNEIARSENPDIMLGKAPERDRQIDEICQM